MTPSSGPGIQVNPLAPMRVRSFEESFASDAPNPLGLNIPEPPPPVDSASDDEQLSPEQRLGYAPSPISEEERALEAKHGQAETAATQFARGALAALLAPGAMIGLQHETLGRMAGVKAWEDFGRDFGRAATGRSALEALAALGAPLGDPNASVTDAADRARIAVDEQEKAWPLLSAGAQVAGGIAFGIGTGGLAQGGVGGIKGLAAVGAVEGGGAGAQAGYEADAPLTEIWTTALIGGTVGAGSGAALGGLGKLKARKGDLAKAFTGDGSVAGTFREKRVAEALGFTKRFQKEFGAEEVNRIARDIQDAHLSDGRAVFPDSMLDAARMDRVDIAERLLQAHDETGEALGNLRKRASAFIDESAPELRPSPTAMATRIEQEIVAPLRSSISPRADTFADQAQIVADKLAALGDDISLEDFAKRRKELDPDIDFGADAPATMKRVRGIIEDDVVARMDMAADRMGIAREYMPLKPQYTSYTRGLEVMDDAVAGLRGNNKLGLTDSILAAGSFAADVTSGFGASAVRAAAVGFGSKLLREKSPALLAVLARRFARTPVAVDVAVAGGREAQDAVTAIVRAKKFMQETAERAGANPSARAVAENTAEEVASEELVRLAGKFEPKDWATAPRAPSPLARVLYRTQILDTVSNDLAPTVERSVAMRPSLDFDIDPKKLARLTKDAQGPEAIGLIQERVREIADGPAGIAPELRRASEVGLENAEYLQSGMRGESFAKVRSEFAGGQPTRPLDVTLYPDGRMVLQDGRHRLLVAKELGLDSLPARVSVMDESGDIISESVGGVPIRAAARPDMGAALARLEKADLPEAIAEAHSLARALERAGATVDARSLMGTLGDDVFGEAGRVYRQMTSSPDDILTQMADPAKLRESLKTLELRGELSEKIAAEHRATIAAYEARKRLTGEAVPADIRREMAALEKAWSRGEENVTLDGTRLGRITNILDNMTETRVESKVARVPLEQQVTETIKPALEKITAPIRRGTGRQRALGAALKGIPRLSAKERIVQYEERLDQLSQALVHPDTEERSAAIGTAPPEVRAALVQAQDQKLKTLMADLPKPKSDSIHGPSMATLSSDDLRLGTAMWEAMMEPLSVFEDFLRGSLDPDKVAYAWKQYPGLKRMAQLGMLDILQSQLSDEERSALPDSVLTQLDLLLGFNGALQSTVSVEFSTRMDQIGQELQQQSATPSPPARNLQLPTARPSLTERISGARR